MEYDEKFSEDSGDLMTVSDFIEGCELTLFTDDDGYGYPVKDGKTTSSFIVVPSKRTLMPKDATHVLWFNK